MKNEEEEEEEEEITRSSLKMDMGIVCVALSLSLIKKQNTTRKRTQKKTKHLNASNWPTESIDSSQRID